MEFVNLAGCEDCVSPERDHRKFFLQQEGQSGGTESSNAKSIPSRTTRCLHDLRVLPRTSPHDTFLDSADLFSTTLRYDDVQEVDARWDEDDHQ